MRVRRLSLRRAISAIISCRLISSLKSALPYLISFRTSYALMSQWMNRQGSAEAYKKEPLPPSFAIAMQGNAAFPKPTVVHAGPVNAQGAPPIYDTAKKAAVRSYSKFLWFTTTSVGLNWANEHGITWNKFQNIRSNTSIWSKNVRRFKMERKTYIYM